VFYRVSGEARQQNQTYPAPGTKTGRSNQVLSLIYKGTEFLPQNQNFLSPISLQPEGVVFETGNSVKNSFIYYLVNNSKFHFIKMLQCILYLFNKRKKYLKIGNVQENKIDLEQV